VKPPLKIAFMTSCRSDFGLISPIITALKKYPFVEPILFATGNHFHAKYGKTIEIVRKQFQFVENWDVFCENPTLESLAESHGKLAVCSARDLASRQPDAFLLLGDRTEILPPAQSAVILGIPIAHVGGGETTKGAVDEKIRFCLSALATWHFVGLPDFKEKVVGVGANPENVFVTGDTALDTILAQPEVPSDELIKTFGFLPDKNTALLAYHSETLSPDLGLEGLRQLISVLDSTDFKIIITYPNSDIGSTQIIEILEQFSKGNKHRFLAPSLGSRIWANLLEKVGFMIGNSSSAIVEAPSFSLPAVNIGKRQAGRLKGKNVIDADPDGESIRKAIRKATSGAFRQSLEKMKNPYGDGNAGKKIARILVEKIIAQKEKQR